MDRQTILNTLLGNTQITNLVTVGGKAQIYLWLTPTPDIFPRVVVRETDDATSLGADNRGVWFRQAYEIGFTVNASESTKFISLCSLIPAAMAGIGGRHVSSGADQPIPEFGVVSKSQSFEFFSDDEEV